MLFDYFKNRKEKREREQAEIAARNAMIDEALKFKETFDKAAEDEKVSRAIIMESDVPWFKLSGDEYSLINPPTEPISDRYEYNKAFIKMLRKQGHSGETDAEVISKWEVREANAKFEAQVKRDRESKITSHEPWIEIVSEKYNKDMKQVAVKLDWNPAFINMLRANGYTGKDEQELVDRWFKSVSESIAMDLHGEKFDA